MRAEVQAVLRWFGQKFALFGLGLDVIFPVIAMIDNRPDDFQGVLIGVALLALGYISFRLYRPGVCTTGDALRLLRQLGFDTSVEPATKGNVTATPIFLGASSALWGGYVVLGSTRDLILTVPIAGAPFGPITVRKCSGKRSLLALRAQESGTASGGSALAAKLKQAAVELDYLDVNLQATETTLAVDV